MFANRKEVDEHVHKMFSKIPPGSERDVKGWAVGRMYSKIQEYTKAIEHLNAYLKVNDDAGAHKLIACCYRQLKSPDYLKAMEHYQRSIQLNPKQPEIIKACCKLLVENKPLCSADRLGYWLELANNVEDLHDSKLLLTLRMRSSTGTGGVMEEENSMELLIQKELLTRPHDIVLHVRLLHNYLEHKRIDEAFNYAYKIELDMPGQCYSTDWYDAVWTVLNKCDQSKETSKDWAYWQLLFITLDRLIQLSLVSESSNSLGESIAHLFMLDQYVFKFSLLSENLSINGGCELHKLCLEHYTGQLLLHAATVLFKRELLGNKNRWSSTVRVTLPLLLLGYQQNCQKANSTYLLRHCNIPQQQLMQLWRHQTAFRCAQLGRTLHGCLQMGAYDATKDWQDNQLQGLWPNSDELLSTARQYCVDNQWRSQVYQQIYTQPDNKLKEQTSHFVRHQRLQQPIYEWPSVAEIEEHEQLALDLAPPTLELHVYLALSTKNLAEAPRIHFYKDLRRDNRQLLSNCSVDTLTQIDVDVFLYAVILQAQRKLHVLRESYNSHNVGNRNATARPYMLPYANIMGRNELISLEQSNWWTAMQRIHDKKNLSENYRGKHRDNIQFGLEVLRCQKEPHIETIMVLQLGKLLASREDRYNLDIRIEAFYRLGINMMLRQQEQNLEPFYRYFEYANANVNNVWLQIQQLAEDALSYLSRQAFKHCNHQKFVNDIRGLKLPMATYLQAEAYRQMADTSYISSSARQTFLDRRIEFLRETKDMLADNPDHPLISVVQRELKVSLGDEFYGSPELHNNSSAYEDAQDDFYAPAAYRLNRSRRQLESQAPLTLQLEQTVKQISKQLCVLKEDVGSGMESMRQDIKMLSEKFDTIEDLLKKLKINTTCNHESHTRDVDAAAAAAALGLDEFLSMEDAIQANYLNAVPQPPNTHERFYPPAGAASHPNAAYSPMFNQNQMYNYFASQAQLMRTPTTAGTVPTAFYGPRGPTSFGVPQNIYQNSTGAPFMEGLNYGIAVQPPSLLNSQAQSFNQPSMPSNVPIVSGTSFFNSAQYVQPASVPQTVQTPLIQKPTPATTPSITPASTPSITPAAAPVTVPITAPVAANMVATTTSVATSAVVPLRTETPIVTIPTIAVPVSSVPAPIFNRVLNNQPVEKDPPANVVITSSDPLPKTVGANSQPTLSVTIPSHHIKPSLVQITEPPAIVGSDFSFNQGNNNGSTNGNNIFSGLSTFSFKPQIAKAAAEKKKELAADPINNESIGSETNNGLCTEISAELDYDPRPDFQGIIPLPDEVVVRTGEEDEKVNFTHRAKLFRHIDKEWKERGIGIIKILTNQSSGCTRILMRREQTHKICANHKITLGMTLTTPDQDNEEKSFIWAANDFADEKVTLEKFLVRFKSPETAKEFKLAFEDAAKRGTVTDLKPPVFGVSKSGAINSFVTSTPAGNALTKHKDTAKVIGVEPMVDPAVPKTLFGNLAGASYTATISPLANFNIDSATKGIKPGEDNVSFGSVSAVTNISTTSTGNTAYTTAFTLGSNIFNKPECALPIQPQQDILSKTTTPDLDTEEEYVPTAQFAPVIPLPELVKVVTGEEDELVLFEHRAKLLRFDKETNEWKERGLGNIKLLQLKTDPTQVRLLMRREQVLKICLNQRLLAHTKFTFAKNSQNVISWAGHDYADQELTTELLCVRFKTADTCKEFYDVVVKSQTAISQEKSNNEVHNIKMDKKLNKDVEIKAKGFGDAFKPKAGSWNCQECYTTNDAAQQYCAACENPKDDTVPPKSSALDQTGALNLSSSAGKFSFGFSQQTTVTPSFNFGAKPPLLAETLVDATNPVQDLKFGDGETAKLTASEPNSLKAVGFGDDFKPKVGSWSCRDCYLSNDMSQLYCVACQAPKDDTVPKKVNNLDGSGGLSFPTHSSKFTFGFGATPFMSSNATASDSKADSNNAAMPKNNTEGSIFDSTSFNFKPMTTTTNSNLASNTFSFSMPKVQQQQPKSPTGNIGAADVSNDDESHVDEEENNAYFAPAIPLPDKIDIKTGEEDEDLLYVQRAKLYRLTGDGEWKERGLGNVKILRHKNTRNLRIVMRREQVLKICLNHVLNSSVVYKTKDEKTWLFAVYDFSEGESVLERLALRFKNADIAQVFYNTVKSALNGTAEPIYDDENPQQPLAAVDSKSEDCTVSNTLELNCELPTSESNCSGCRGCEPEKFNYGKPAKGEVAILPLPLTLPAMMLPPSKNHEQVQANDVVASPNRTLLKASTLAANSTTKSFGCFSNTVSVSSTATTAASPMVTESKSTGLGGGFVFGNAEKPVFGQSASQFGGNADKPQHSIFGGFLAVDNKLSNQTDSIFGSGVKTQADIKDVAPKSIFSPVGDGTLNTNSKSSPCFMFASTAASSGIFGNQTKDNIISFEKISSSNDKAKDNKENISEPIGTKPSSTPLTFDLETVNCFSELAAKAGDDFASLAAKGTSNPIGFQKSDTGGFFGLTHQDDFKNFKSPCKSTITTVADDNSTEIVNDDENYDPHYEPIIALPNEIVVCTGEEDELKLFGERTTLFRYDSDTNEWKERGVGELKILKHKTLKTHRMILRREQILKLVLNMTIGKDFTFDYMSGQKKSFVWANFNYYEYSDGVLERLACRFKKQELADQFHKTIEMCVAEAKLMAADAAS